MKRRQLRHAGCWIAVGLGVFGCGTQDTPSASASATPELAEAERERVAAELDERAARSLAVLRERHPGLFRHEPLEHGERALSLVLPDEASGAVEIAEPTSGVRVEVSLLDAVPARAGHVAGVRVYAGGAGPDTTLLYQQRSASFEDFVSFEAPPPEPALRYQLALSAGVHGLRLVARTLELLDVAGVPRLRVAPPYLLGADGARVEAELGLEGCDVDVDPAPPWGRPVVPPGARACQLVVAWDEARLVYPALLDPVWSTTGELGTARERFALSELPGGLLLAAGGVSSAGRVLRSAELYDPGSGSWAATGDLAVGRSDHTLSVAAEAFVLAAGGRSDEGLLASVESYDTRRGTWQAAPALPGARAGHAALTLRGGDVLIAGGEGGAAALRFSPLRATWASAGVLLAEEPGATLTALANGRVLLVGPNPPAAQLYDPAAQSWVETRAPAVARSGHSATRLVNGRVLIAGGSTKTETSSGISQAVEIYEPVTASWAQAGGLLEARRWHTATRLVNGRVAVVGGVGDAGTSASIELFDPTWGTWTSGPPMSTARARHAAALLGDGQLLVVGGAALEPETPAPLPVLAADARPAGIEVLPSDAGPRAPFDAAPPPSDAGPSLGPEGSVVLDSAERFNAAATPVTITEYKLLARRDPEVVASTTSELWAAVARPTQLTPGRRYPLLMFLHGNHATCGTGQSPRSDVDCSYTQSGVCPAGYIVAPSHRGYDYVGAELAARGYIVVSVNANRGINCGDGDGADFSMNLARGRLLLKHLQRLSEWNRGVSATPRSIGVNLAGQLDFSQVGLMGHSRGGEGARAAYQQYRDAGSPWPARIVEPLSIRAIFEIGPVDGQTPRTLNADGVAWAVLLPMCDGDVVDLAGVRPFDRMLGLAREARVTLKATQTAWGTNHNFFNTQWQESDSSGCLGHRALFGPSLGSAEQRQIGLASMLDFFLANVGTELDVTRNGRFDPSVRLHTHTRVDRGFIPGIGRSSGLSLEDFRAPSGVGASGLRHRTQGVNVEHEAVPEHDPSLRAARVHLRSGTDSRFFEIQLAAAGQGLDVSGYDSLDVRIDRAVDLENPAGPTPLTLQLVGADGAASEPLEAAAYGLSLDGPVGGPTGTAHVMLQTLRVPLSDFGVDSHALRAVRFGFPGDAGGSLYITQLRVSAGRVASAAPRALAAGPAPAAGAAAGAAPATAAPSAGPLVSPQVLRTGNRVAALARAGAGVEIELSAAEPFRIQDDLLVLDVGGLQSRRSRHPGGDLRRVIFTLEPDQFARSKDGDRLIVRHAASQQRSWDFGALDKSRLVP